MKSKARFLLSKKKALEQYHFIKSYGDEVSYSLKTNYELGKLLRDETNCSFSVHTTQSAEFIDAPERIWFFLQATDSEELAELKKLGVRKFVVDNENDLQTLVDFIDSSSLDIELLLRMKLKENTIHTGKHFVFGMKSHFVNDKIHKLRENPKISKLGIHFHRKTQNVSEWSLKYELSQALNQSALEKVDYVNIGGGIPVAYKNYRAEVLDNILSKLTEFREWLNSYNIKMIVEPGRFIAGPCIELETTIKNIYNGNIIIDASVYNSAMDTFVADFRLRVKGEKENGTPYAIKGCTPCSMDLFRYRVYLDNPKIGDKIIFENAGAYNFWTSFCNLQKIPTEIIT